ncbi:putative leader peptide [Streptomyces sp. NPDC051921]|uniref:putative leader peptide n=1 Tax=Streptomyces sp. NPDC051921 TaxID=3155806 RepID=UPI003418033C
MSPDSVCEPRREETLTCPVFTATLLLVSASDNLAARLHVDLRRQASAICAVGR